jgi:hypothetical protein
LCRACLQRGVVTEATIADHIKEWGWDDPRGPDLYGPEGFWFGELQSLCAEHHAHKRKDGGDSQERNFQTGCDENGYPSDRAHPVYKLRDGG